MKFWGIINVRVYLRVARITSVHASNEAQSSSFNEKKEDFSTTAIEFDSIAPSSENLFNSVRFPLIQSKPKKKINNSNHWAGVVETKTWCFVMWMFFFLSERSHCFVVHRKNWHINGRCYVELVNSVVGFFSSNFEPMVNKRKITTTIKKRVRILNAAKILPMNEYLRIHGKWFYDSLSSLLLWNKYNCTMNN